MITRDALVQRVKSVPPRAAVAVGAVALLVFFLGRMAQLPGFDRLTAAAPPCFPWPEFFLAIGAAIFMWSFRREADNAKLLLRILALLVSAIIVSAVYLPALRMLSVAPPPGREGNRCQIGLYMYVLTQDAKDRIAELANAKPPKELHTPDDLMNAFGVWGNKGRTEEIWPLWSIVVAGCLLAVLFLTATALWCYSLGALARFLTSKDWTEDVVKSVSRTAGHFVYESGYHGQLWIDMDSLLSDAKSTQGWGHALSRKSKRCRPDIICGVSTDGGVVAQIIASELDAKSVVMDRISATDGPVEYRVPDTLRSSLSGKRVMVVDVAVNTGTALRSVITDIKSCRGDVVGIATLLYLGRNAIDIEREHGVGFFCVGECPCEIWSSKDCPLCERGVPAMQSLSVFGQGVRVAAAQLSSTSQIDK